MSTKEIVNLIDPNDIAMSMAVVTQACAEFDLGDPFDEAALTTARALFAEDLASDPAVVSTPDAITINGPNATWTLGRNGHGIRAVEAQSAGASEPAASDSPPGQDDSSAIADDSPVTAHVDDLVGQLERLARLKTQGFLSDAEFVQAKLRLLT